MDDEEQFAAAAAQVARRRSGVSADRPEDELPVWGRNAAEHGTLIRIILKQVLHQAPFLPFFFFC